MEIPFFSGHLLYLMNRYNRKNIWYLFIRLHTILMDYITSNKILRFLQNKFSSCFCSFVWRWMSKKFLTNSLTSAEPSRGDSGLTDSGPDHPHNLRPLVVVVSPRNSRSTLLAGHFFKCTVYVSVVKRYFFFENFDINIHSKYLHTHSEPFW